MFMNVEQTVSDAELLARYRGGDQAAAALLHEKYVSKVTSLARQWMSEDLKPRVDADDVAQSVFRTFFRRVAGGQYDAPDQEELWRLLLTIALNKLRNSASYHRAAKRGVARTVNFSAETESGEDNESEVIVKLLVEELLGRLGPAQRDLVRMRILGCSVDEIALASKRSKRTVERTLQEFRLLLGSALEDVT